MASAAPSPCELQVLEAVCRPGASIAGAAHELGIAPGTARNTLRSLVYPVSACRAPLGPSTSSWRPLP